MLFSAKAVALVGLCATCMGFVVHPKLTHSAAARPFNPFGEYGGTLHSASASLRGRVCRLPVRRSVSTYTLAAAVQDSILENESRKPYRTVDEKMLHTVVMPIGEETTSKSIRCKITKSSLLLFVDGKRIIDGEMWGEVKADTSSWEIDEYKDSTGKDPRCIIIRLQKKIKEDWPFVVRGDYDLDAADWANRRIVSETNVTKEQVEQALQLIVSLLKPSGLRPQTTGEPSGEAAAGLVRAYI